MRVKSYQFFCERRQPCPVEVAKPISNLDILPFDVAQIAHSFLECSNPARMCLFRRVNEITDERPPVDGLRPRCDGPRRRRASEQRDELAPPDHSITSSARASNGGGTSTKIWNFDPLADQTTVPLC